MGRECRSFVGVGVDDLGCGHGSPLAEGREHIHCPPKLRRVLDCALGGRRLCGRSFRGNISGFRMPDSSRATGRRHHGVVVRLGDDEARRGDPRAIRRSSREAHRVRASDARLDGGVRGRRRGARPAGDHRRRRRRCASARHGRRAHPAAGARCAGAERRAPGPRLAAVDRPDARRRSGGHARDRQAGRRPMPGCWPSRFWPRRVRNCGPGCVRSATSRPQRVRQERLP